MDMIEVGKRIRFLRERKNMNRNQLANKAGVSPTYIYQLEKGEKSPTVEYLSHICFGLDVSLFYFFNIEEDQANEDKISTLSDKQKELLNAFLRSL